MTSASYSVSITTLGPVASPDLNQIYGVLFSNGAPTDWPASLTSISILTAAPITSISAKTMEFWGADNVATGSFGYGQLHSGGSAVRWPETATGNVGNIFAGSATATSTLSTLPTPSTTSIPSTASSQTTTTSNTSVTSGTATTSAANTKTGTSEVPTSTSSSSPPVRSSSSGISTGATAGIAIGCALVGLAIGLLAAFCLFRRRRQRNSSVNNAVRPRESEAYPSDKGTPTPDIQLNQFLLEATPDRDIAQETQSIGALTDQHVESFYHTHAITVDSRALTSALTQVGFQSTANSASLDAQAAAALCLNPRSRRVGLRHVLMRILFSSIDSHSPHGPSMLPAPAASFLRAIPPAESDRFGDPQANALALRKWRKLSAFLLHPARSQRTSLPPGDAVVAMQAQELANSLNSFLRFFVDQQQQQQQAGHLQAVIEECAKLGYMLFSHPSDWEFIYDAGAPTRGVVVEAGLCKLGGRDGAPTASPQMLLEPVVVSPQSSR